ncbi:hypothetical protein [Bradyrhizobium guangdongense]
MAAYDDTPEGEGPGLSLARLIEGKLPLGTAFWTYHVLISTVVVGFGGGVIFGPNAIFLALATLVQLAVTVGVWRSAYRYNGSRLWAILASLFSGVALLVDTWLFFISLIGK